MSERAYPITEEEQLKRRILTPQPKRMPYSPPIDLLAPPPARKPYAQQTSRLHIPQTLPTARRAYSLQRSDRLRAT